MKAAITVLRPQADLERLWRELSDDEEVFSYLGSVDPSAIRFATAPGDRGTEIHVDVDESTFGGAIGDKVKRIVGSSPEQQADDDLRRFKQVAETGEIVRSDGSPRGAGPKQHRAQRAAQPLGEPVGASS